MSDPAVSATPEQLAEAIAYREWNARQWQWMLLFILLFAGPLALLFTGAFFTQYLPAWMTRPGSGWMEVTLLALGMVSITGLIGLLVHIARLAMRKPGDDRPKAQRLPESHPMAADRPEKLTAREQAWRKEKSSEANAEPW